MIHSSCVATMKLLLITFEVHKPQHLLSKNEQNSKQTYYYTWMKVQPFFKIECLQ